MLCSEKKPAEILHRKVTIGAAVVATKKKKELGTGHVRMAPKAQVLPVAFEKSSTWTPSFLFL
jgi:hypothetical protein